MVLKGGLLLLYRGIVDSSHIYIYCCREVYHLRSGTLSAKVLMNNLINYDSVCLFQCCYIQVLSDLGIDTSSCCYIELYLHVSSRFFQFQPLCEELAAHMRGVRTLLVDLVDGNHNGDTWQSKSKSKSTQMAGWKVKRRKSNQKIEEERVKG